MIDLRSDTVTRPSLGMRRAMAEAEVGDDVYREDPTVNSLEERTAELLGHEAGLFCPSGSMTNMLGIAAQVPRGWEVLAESQAHILRAECGGHAALAGVTSRTWVSADGTFDASQALSLVSRPRGYNQVGTAVVSVENTHNFGGGRIADFEQLSILRSRTRELGVRVHVDGARLPNASAATGISLCEYGRLADSVSLCLSKGLGAPVGSVLVGSTDLVEEARSLRKRYGGGMRQAGILAAAGLWALGHNVGRVAEDNAGASAIAHRIAEVDPTVVDPQTVETNIVFLDLSSTGLDAEAFAASAEAAGVRVSVMGETSVRIVTHLDISADDVRRAGEVLARCVSENA
ncbi:low-specificity L-threonine aldolase [Brevibacterium daeguense]|uniref:Low-specificity L-threonine aldolase n=1 Tax=Brevibacterium daeguense TaxID=909936 RepID=A0ABP8EMV8_9MICO|nr:GntG family PLP-dependent aldolase [Brevibacterium daeguense]